VTHIERNESQPWVRSSRDVVARRLGDEIVLVHLQTNRIYLLNRTGARFWELLAEGDTRQTIEQRLLDEFEVDLADVAAEIDRLLTVLEDAGLVERCP
jgi:Coenzyme PQQ synthesis protein D (PqqD)